MRLIPESREFKTRTEDIDVRVGSTGAVIVVAEGEIRVILVGELGRGADTRETPRGVGPECMHEYHGFP